MPHKILNHFVLIATKKVINIGNNIAKNIPKLPTDPIVLKLADFAKSKGIINNPKSWSTPYNPASKQDSVNTTIDIKISFLEKILEIIKYNKEKQIIVSKLSEVTLGQPQKLPYLSREKIVDTK